MNKAIRFWVWCVLILLIPVLSFAGYPVREQVVFPDIMGYKLLKCDFHAHTIFSDGQVWPTVRIEEAWQNGLDVFTFTEHVEYQRFKDYIKNDLNASYNLSKSTADQAGLILIRGAEITRDMPPGHINAIFLKDAELLRKDEWRDAIKEAHEQGAFIFWNHPSWTGQQPDGIAKWYPEHTELYENGYMNGIEVFNSLTYSPNAHKWALEKNLTMLGNSDIHPPISLRFDPKLGEHRPMTLVMVKDKSVEGIKEALFAGRTIVYFEDTLVGKEEYLKAMFENSIDILQTEFQAKNKKRIYVPIRNNSSVDIKLVLREQCEKGDAPKKITLYAGKTGIMPVKVITQDKGKQTIQLPYIVENYKVLPDQGLPVDLTVDVTVE